MWARKLTCRLFGHLPYATENRVAAMVYPVSCFRCRLPLRHREDGSPETVPPAEFEENVEKVLRMLLRRTGPGPGENRDA